MELIDLLRKACKNKGVDPKYAERIEKAFKVTKAEDVESSVESFKENVLPAITQASEDAKKEAGKTAADDAVKAFREKHNLDEEGKPISKSSSEEEDDDAPKWFKSYKKEKDAEMEDLKKQIKTNQTNSDTEKKKADAAKLIKAAELPEKWVDRIDLNSETSIEDQVTELETEYADIQQNSINKKIESGEFKPGFQQPKERSEEEWAKIMNESEETSDPGVVDLGV